MFRYVIYPDYWEFGAGSEPVRGPIEASDARTAYHEAIRKNLYPAGVTFGLRVIGIDQRDMWSAARERQALPDVVGGNSPDCTG